MLQDTITNFYMALLAGNVDALTGIFASEPLINTPLSGKVKGTKAFRQFVTEQQAWLEEREANPELFALTATNERMVAARIYDDISPPHAGD